MERNLYDIIADTVFEHDEENNAKFVDTKENRQELIKRLKTTRNNLKALKTKLDTELITTGVCGLMVPYLGYQYQMVSANPSNPFDGFIRACQIANIAGIIAHLVKVGYNIQEYSLERDNYDKYQEFNRQVLSGEAVKRKKAYDAVFLDAVTRYNDEAEKETVVGPTLILDDMRKYREERKTNL